MSAKSVMDGLRMKALPTFFSGLLALAASTASAAPLTMFAEGDCSLNGMKAGAPCARGLKDASGRIVVPAQYHSIGKFSEGLAAVSIKMGHASYRIGFIDEAGRPVIPASFDAASDFKEGFAAVKRGDLWGYINQKGVLVVPYRYTGAADFSRGRAAISMGRDKQGLVDITGRELVPAKFRQVVPFSNGYIAVANDDDLWGLVDRNGREITAQKYTGIADFRDGLARVNVDGRITADKSPNLAFSEYTLPRIEKAMLTEPKGKFGFINLQGQEAVAVKYDSVDDFKEGYARVFVKRKGWGLVDSTGREVVAPAYAGIDIPDSGLIPIKVENKGWGFIDMNGATIVAPAWESIGNFSEGLATVCQPIKKKSFYLCGYVDRSGKQVLPVQYAMAGKFDDGRAKVCNPEGTLCGYIDRTGKEVIPVKYTVIRGFSEGLNAVQSGPDWGYIDSNGRELIPPQFEYADDFQNGRAYVNVKGNAQWPGEKFFIDRSGKYLSGGVAYDTPGTLEFNVGLSFLQQNRYELAMPWMRQSADKGYGPGMHLLGLGYANGEGITKDIAQARMWLARARDKGIAKAGADLAELGPGPTASTSKTSIDEQVRVMDEISRINREVSEKILKSAEETRRKNEEIDKRTRAEIEAIRKQQAELKPL